MLRRHSFQFCYFSLHNIPWYALNLQHVFAHNYFSNSTPSNQTQFPCKLSSAVLAVLAKKYSSVHFLLNTHPSTIIFHFLGLCFLWRWQEVGWVLTGGGWINSPSSTAHSTSSAHRGDVAGLPQELMKISEGLTFLTEFHPWNNKL